MADTTGSGFDYTNIALKQLEQQLIIQQAQLAFQKYSYNHTLALQSAEAAAQNAVSLIQTYGNQGIQALQQAGQLGATMGDLQVKAGQLGVSVGNLLASLQGPSNAFAYDRAITGLRGAGLGGSIGALTGQSSPTAFGAMGPTQPMTLGSMNQDLGGTNGGNSFGPNNIFNQIQGQVNQGNSIVNQLLGVSGTAFGKQQAAEGGWSPVSIPQFDTNGNQLSGNTSSASANTYNTVNGPRTPAQMLAELNTAAGGTWNGDHSDAGVAAAYGNVTKSPVTLAGTNTPAPPFTMNNAATTAGTPSAASNGGYSPQAQNYLDALPNPNQANARNFFAQPEYSRQLQLSGYAAKGYDPGQLTEMWKAQLPQIGGPSFSMVG